MTGQSKGIFLGIFVLTALAVLFCVTRLERVPVTRWTRPSREAESNDFLALERWLDAAGIAWRIRKRGDIRTLLEGPEKTAFIESASFDWSEFSKDGDDMGESLTRWIAEGGSLLISWNSTSLTLGSYLKGLGISLEEADWTSEESPYSLDWYKAFTLAEQQEPVDRRTVLWHGESIRLVSLFIGEGRLTVTGETPFLHSYQLRNKNNEDLAWDLLVNPGTNGGVLFVRGSAGDRRFFGALFDRGNPLPFAGAAALLVITGFWMVIPLFGRFKPEPELPGKPLRERFLAEGRFLKKHGQKLP